MTGPEHYQRAQELLAAAAAAVERGDFDGADRHVRFAQAHAQLATAAAAALATDLMRGPDTYAWTEVAGTKLSSEL
ncbi:MAG: hypothetical protein ACRDS0_35875 [Pseudonocardiaceae bacterium]